MLGAIGTAMGGIGGGLDALDRAAGRIARDGADPSTIVGMKRAQQDVRANVAVVRLVTETIGTLLDVWA